VQIATRRVADTVIATPEGRIDHQSAARFEAALTPLVAEAGARHAPLVLDFSGVDYISSVGLRVLMVAAKQMREHKAPFLVTALQGVVAEIFAISRFDRVLTVVPTLDAALAQAGSAGSAPAP
jgi:anti-anti-sigma factor